MAIVEPKDSDKFPKLLRQFFLESFQEKWSKQVSHGRYEPVRDSKYTNAIVFGGDLSINKFKFIHSARTDTLRINGKSWSLDKTCRKCQAPHESQTHVFILCPHNYSIVMARHNNVLKILEKFILKYTDCKVAAYKEPAYTNSLQ